MKTLSSLVLGSVLVLCACDPDARLERKVEGNIAAEGLPAVEVSVHDRVVTLRGTVDTQMDRFRAENAARTVEGVRWVENEIDLPLWPEGEGDQRFER